MWLPVRREYQRGVEILRANGTTFHTQKFVNRASNYISYFLSACLAGMRVCSPNVVASLTDPPIFGLAVLLTAGRVGARLVYLC